MFLDVVSNTTVRMTFNFQQGKRFYVEKEQQNQKLDDDTKTLPL